MDREDQIQTIIENLTKLQRPSLKGGAWKELGLSHAQVGMLYLLSFHKQSSVKQTADFLGITKSAVTQLAGPLVTKNYISRNNDLDDRRIVRLSLTEDGRRALKRLAKHKFDSVRTAIGNLNDSEVEQLNRLVQKAAKGESS